MIYYYYYYSIIYSFLVLNCVQIIVCNIENWDELISNETCIEKFDAHAKKCLSDVREDWKIAEFSDSNNIRDDYCCGFWDAIECITKEAENFCEGKELREFHAVILANQHEAEEGYCEEFPRGSTKCHFSWWKVLLISIGCYVIITAIVLSILSYYKKKNKIPKCLKNICC